MDNDHYPLRGRKEQKQERKRASARDRSKYKKSNWDKREEQERPQSGEEGRVLSVTGLRIEVERDGKRFNCVLRGTLKQERTRMRRLVTVGDIVYFKPTTPGEGVILGVAPRRSLLERADPLHPHRRHIIAANIDQVLITASILSPPLKPPLIDRYLMSAEQGGMEPLIVVNKIDQLADCTEEEQEQYAEFLRVYPSIGYRVIPVSASTREGIDALIDAMHGKASVFSGQSGSGKSSLINATLGLDLPVGEVVERTRKGAHTTTTATLVEVESGGWCIDTPGVKSFGLLELSEEQIRAHFHEIAEVGQACHFPNCTHTHEPKCAVVQSVESGELSPMRYASYCSLLEESQTGSKPR